MATLTIRNVDEGVANALTQEADKKGVGREELVRQILGQYVAQIGIPRRGYVAYAKNGTEIHLINSGEDVFGSTSKGPGLSQAQITALRKAELLANPKNGSKWSEARAALEAVDLEVFEA